MPKKRTKEEQAAYMRDYRARIKDRGPEPAYTVEKAVEGLEGREITEVRLFEVSLVADTPENRAAGSHPITVRDPIDELEIADVDWILDTVPAQRSDRERGLPRSNYASDHKAPGGWTEVIQNIDPKLSTKILDKVAPPRRQR